jgi:DNA gyrase subunit A
MKKTAYIDYSMSVIVSRAPDVRDGLKPVHRRVLLNALELTQYHPTKSLQELSVLESITHMEILLFMTMVRMAQEWSMRYY